MASYWLWCIVIRVFKQGFNNSKELAKNEVEESAKKERIKISLVMAAAF